MTVRNIMINRYNVLNIIVDCTIIYETAEREKEDTKNQGFWKIFSIITQKKKMPFISLERSVEIFSLAVMGIRKRVEKRPL